MRNWQAQLHGGARIGKRENCVKQFESHVYFLFCFVLFLFLLFIFNFLVCFFFLINEIHHISGSAKLISVDDQNKYLKMSNSVL